MDSWHPPDATIYYYRLPCLIFKESVPPLVLETINDPRLSAERVLVPEVAAVLVGFDGSFQYWNLLLAASYLADKEVGGLLQMQSYLL